MVESTWLRVKQFESYREKHFAIKLVNFQHSPKREKVCVIYVEPFILL